MGECGRVRTGWICGKTDRETITRGCNCRRPSIAIEIQCRWGAKGEAKLGGGNSGFGRRTQVCDDSGEYARGCGFGDGLLTCLDSDREQPEDSNQAKRSDTKSKC